MKYLIYIVWFIQKSARVKNNGWLSDTFNLNRGIRQGCPVSALLFIIVVETLALNIKSDNRIEGIKLNIQQHEREIKIAQYADDTVLFLNNYRSMDTAIETVKNFSKVAGLSLNIEKSEAIHIRLNAPPLVQNLGISWVDSVRCLGIYIGNSIEYNIRKNWDEKIEKLIGTLESWKKRNHSMFGKITVIKMLAMPKLTYSATNTAVPEDKEKEISSALYSFVWNGHDRLKRSNIINPVVKVD